MKRKLALKRLSASDLTFFEHHFRNTTGTKQKAFNLDRSVFIDKLFPLLPDAVGSGRAAVSLSIYGPGLAGIHILQRKVLKQQKNWRLDGELIYDPPETENRYAMLKKGDFAIFDFSGEAEPKGANVFLVTQNDPVDSALHATLLTKYGDRFSPHVSMVELDPDELGDLINSAALVEGHPVIDLLDSEALEDAVQGGFSGVEKLKKRRKGRGVSKDEFERAKKAAEEIGRLGEEVLNAYLDDLKERGEIHNFEWVSENNHISPFDFTLIIKGHSPRKIDAKSTAGAFENPIHISMAELNEMAYGHEPYDIYRLYAVSERYARLKIAADVRDFAEKVVMKLEELPKGVTADGISVVPRTISFSGEIVIDLSVELELVE